METGTTFKSVSGDDLKNIVFTTPGIEEQKKISNYLDRETTRIDKLISEKQNFIKLLKEKRQALISHVVTKGLDPTVKMKESGIEWIGEVPEHWAVSKLSYRYEVLLGKMLDEKKSQGITWDVILEIRMYSGTISMTKTFLKWIFTLKKLIVIRL